MNLLRCGAEVTVSSGDGVLDDYLLTLPVAGSGVFRYGDAEVLAGLGRGVIIGPHREFEFAFDAAWDQVIVRLDRARVESVRLAPTLPDIVESRGVAGSVATGSSASLSSSAEFLELGSVCIAGPVAAVCITERLLGYRSGADGAVGVTTPTGARHHEVCRWCRGLGHGLGAAVQSEHRPAG